MSQTIDMRGILFPNPSSPIFASNYRLGDRPVAGGAWQFTKAIQYGAKRPLYPIYPRPTGEVNSFATHLWAHSTMPYELKPCASFGAWPHKWSLTTSPAGMTIGGELTRTTVDGLINHTVGSTYQKVVLAGTKPSSFAVGIRCQDQLLNEVNYAYTVTRDDTKFVFVDINAANDSGDGTINSPKKFFSSVWTSGNAGKTVVLRAGTHTCTEAGDAVNVGFNKSNRPTAIIGYPGETVTVTGSFWRDGGAASSCDDLVIRNFKATDYTGTDNTHVFRFGGTQKRVHFADVTFDNIVNGSVGDDNQSCIIFRESGAAHEDISIIDCGQLSGCKVSLFIIFHIERLLFERPFAYGVVVPESNGGGFFNIKDQSNDICVRGDRFIGELVAGIPCIISNQNAPGNNIEHCWYTTVIPNQSAVIWNPQRFLAGGSNQFDYAGSVRTPGADCMVFTLWVDSTLKVVNEGMAAYGWSLYAGGALDDGVVAGAVANQFLASTQLNATTGLLEGANLTNNRLNIGSELWSNP